MPKELSDKFDALDDFKKMDFTDSRYLPKHRICRQNVSSMQIAPELFNCRPSLCNSIFVNQNNLLVSDDKLYIGMVNMAYVTRNLSRYGLPYSN